jgi:hypothetical protein
VRSHHTPMKCNAASPIVLQEVNRMLQQALKGHDDFFNVKQWSICDVV